MEREKRVTSEYILRGINFKAVNLVGVQKKTKGYTPFLVLDFNGKSAAIDRSITTFVKFIWLDDGDG